MYARERFVGTAMALVLGLAMITGLFVMAPPVSAQPPLDAWIIGVVDDGTDPVPDAYVKVLLFMAGNIEMGYSITDSEGEYLIGVPGGYEYMVLVANGNYYMTLTTTSVSTGESAWVNLTLEPIAPLTADVIIKGYVKDAHGVPSSDGHVLGLSNNPEGGDIPHYANVAVPGADGYFQVNVLASATGGGAIAMDFPGYSMVDNTTTDALVSGQTYWFNITLMDSSALDDAMIYGHVTDQGTGEPIAGALVGVDIENEWLEESYSNVTFADSDGYYEMFVTNGTARIMVMKEGYSIGMIEKVNIMPDDELQLDAELVLLDCLVTGYVTDLKSDSPLSMAQVLLVDSNSNLVIANTDDSGYYELEAFSGTGMTMMAEMEGYSSDRVTIDLSPGEEASQDFGLWPASALLEGAISDAITGSWIAGAEVWASSEIFSIGAESNGTGQYSMQLVPGTYRVGVNAPGYMGYEVTGLEVVDEATTVLDFVLLQENPPLDTKVYGWVNDSGTLNGIDSADVRIGLPSIHMNWGARTDSTGYYELNVPSVEGLTCLFTAYQHAPSFDVIDASESTDFRMDVLLDPDAVGPVVSYSQAPTENVSWTNPCDINITVQEENLRQLVLFHSMFWYNDGTYDNFYLISGGSVSFDPFEGQSSSLEYSQDGSTFYVNESFDGTVSGGWLQDGTESWYLPGYEQHWGFGYSYYALRGFYTNGTLDYYRGTALFDFDTGEFLMFAFDEDLPAVEGSDASGLFCPEVNRLYTDESDPQALGYAGSTGLGNMSVADLVFDPDPVAPSGRYMTLFFTSDFGGMGSQNVTHFTVDNEGPVADAGFYLPQEVDTECTIDGSDSSDNVGIVSFAWEFEDGGVPVTRDVPTFTYTFTSPGTYVLTLTVVDGAGHEDSDTATVTVQEDLPPVADAGDDQEVDEDTVVDFDGTDSDDDFLPLENWTWAIDDLEVEMYGPTPSYTFSEPGVYAVELVVMDSAGQWSDPDTMTVTVLDVTPPVADAGPDPVGVLVGEVVTLDGSGSTDNVLIVDYSWNFSDEGNVILSGAEIEYAFDTEGDYVVTLTVTDLAGNSDDDTVVVRVASPNEGPIADAGGDLTVKAGDTVTLDGSDSTDDVGIETYTWTFEYDGEVKTLSGEVAEFVFDIPDTYIVTLNVTDAEGEWSTDTMFIIVEENALTEYWWLFAALAAVAVIAVLVVLMRRGKGGTAPSKGPDEEEEGELEEEELPPPDDEDA